MRFGFIARLRGIWPGAWFCEALGVSRSGFHAWLKRPPSRRTRSDEILAAKVRASFIASDRTYSARRVWHDMLAEGISCRLHRIERLMRAQGLRARPRRRRLPVDAGVRPLATIAPNVLDRAFEAPAPNRKWIADFTPPSRGQALHLARRRLAVCGGGHRPVLAVAKYTSEPFQRLLAEHGIACSMSRSGNVWDKAAVDSVFCSLKTERTAGKTYRTRD